MRVRAAGGEGGAVRAGLRPAMVATEAVGLVGRVAGLQVGEGGQHGWDSGGGDVDRRAGRGVHVIPGVMSVRGLVGGQGQALIHFNVLLGIWKNMRMVLETGVVDDVHVQKTLPASREELSSLNKNLLEIPVL